MQEIITYLIIATAVVIVLLNIYKILFPAKNGNQHGGCSSDCKCDAKLMRKELLSKKLQSN